MLRAMKMTAMAAELERQTGDASYRELNTEERLSLIVNAEWNRRQNNKINRLSNAAHFAQPGATMEGIEYFEDRKLDKSLLLRLSTCKYIESGHHIILKGASGNGKTYLACALGNAACRSLNDRSLYPYAGASGCAEYCEKHRRAAETPESVQEGRPSDY